MGSHKVKLSDGKEHRVRDAEFDVVKQGHVVLETENGTRIRYQPVIEKVFEVIDENGEPVLTEDGERVVKLETSSIIHAEREGGEAVEA